MYPFSFTLQIYSPHYDLFKIGGGGGVYAL